MYTHHPTGREQYKYIASNSEVQVQNRSDERVTNGTLLGDGEENKKNFSDLFTSDMKGTMQGSVRVKWRCSNHGHPPNLIHHLAGTPILCPRNSRAHLASHSSVFSKAEKNGAIPECLLDIVPPSFRSGSSSFSTRLLSRFQLSGKVFRFHLLTAANCKLRIQTPPSVLSSHHLRVFFFFFILLCLASPPSPFLLPPQLIHTSTLLNTAASTLRYSCPLQPRPCSLMLVAAQSDPPLGSERRRASPRHQEIGIGRS